jgi:hypothetical protein
MRNRKLHLEKETLTELDARDLNGVVGAATGNTCLLNCIVPQSDFVQCVPTHRCPTLDGCFTGTTTTN